MISVITVRSLIVVLMVLSTLRGFELMRGIFGCQFSSSNSSSMIDASSLAEKGAFDYLAVVHVLGLYYFCG